jgi:PAS domain S-box-containing protein
VRSSGLARYSAAIIAAGFAILARLALDPVWGSTLPFITLFPAIMLSAWLGGFWPGIITTIITGAAAGYFWIEPRRSWAVSDPSGLLGLLVFVAVGGAISALNEAWRRAVGAVADSEERLKSTLLGLGEGVIATDRQACVVQINPVAQALTGWNEADALGQPLTKVFFIVEERSRKPAENPVLRVLREGTIAGVANHTLLISRDGREIPIDDSAAPIKAADGSVAGAVLIFRDITERRRAERERAELLENERGARRAAAGSEQQLRLALEAGRMGTWEWTIGTGGVEWSTGLEALHGLAPGTFAGTFDAVQREIHAEDRDRVLEAISSALELGREYRTEYRIVRCDGAIRWVEGTGQISYDATGRPERMTGVCTDITERKLAEERFRVAVEAAPTAMLMIDPHGAIVLVNRLAEELLGYTRAELLGETVERLVPTRFRSSHQAYRQAFFADARQRAMGAGRDLYALRKDGTEIAVEIGLNPIQTADGLCVIAAVSDITQRKRTEDALKEADRRKDEFLATLSHELRNPINAVLGWARMLRSGALPPERTSHGLEILERNALAEARLIESLLDLSRISAGKLELDVRRVDVGPIVQAAVEAVRPDASAKGVDVELTIGSSPSFIVGDPGRLQQVVANLLSNALKFTPSGGHVQVRVERAASDVSIQVADDGEGISPEFLPAAFDRFRQAETGNDRRHAGLGLGLAIVRELVHAHGGRVGAASAGSGKGSTFTVTLPIRAVADASSEPGAAAAEPSTRSIGGLKLLVVDDDRDARELLAVTLESRGAQVRTVSSAAEALELIARDRFHVLIADIGMPEGDGYSLLHRLRDLERSRRQRRLPAIAVTAYATASDREQALAAGFDLHLAKPVDPTTLVLAVARFATVAGMGDAPHRGS